MTYAVVLLLAFCIVVMLRDYRNKFAICMMLMALSLALVVLSQLLFLQKHGNYPIGHGFYSLDVRLYILLSFIRMPYRQIFQLNNLGVAMYAATVSFFSVIFSYGGRGIPKGNRWQVVIYLLFPVLYLTLYHPETCYHMYLWLYGGSMEKRRLILCTMDLVIQLMLLFCITWPVASFFFHLRFRPRSDFIRKRVSVIAFCLLCIDILFLLTYYGPLNRIYFLQKNLPAALLKQSYNLRYYFSYRRSVPFGMCVVIISMFLLLVRHDVIGTADVFHGSGRMSRGASRFNKRMREIMHSYKNTFFVQQILLDKLSSEYGTEEGRATLRRLSEINSQKMKEVTHTLDTLHTPRRQNSLCSVTECVEKAVENLPPHSGAAVSFTKPAESFTTIFDERHLTEVFVNILQNAVDAVLSAGRSEGFVVVKVFHEQELIIVQFSDNGIGMTPGQIRRIFKPYYSTKPADKGWGLGLSYASNMVHLQHGIINVYSTPGSGSTFEVCLYDAERTDILGRRPGNEANKRSNL